MARRARAGSAAPESTAHDCAIESMRHRRSPPTRAACRRRNTRDGTSCHPMPHARPPAVIAAACARHVSARFVVAARRPRPRAHARAPCAGTSRATRSRLCPRRRRDSCRRSSPPFPSAAGHGRRRRGCDRWRAHNARTACRARPTMRGSKNVSSCPAASTGPSRNGECPRRGSRDRRSRRDSAARVGQPEEVVGEARAHAAARGSCHQCCTSPSTNWRDAAFRMCARAGRALHDSSAMTSCS